MSFSFATYLLMALNAECWAETKDVHGFGGVSLDVATLAECQAACINDIRCAAIDWEPSNAGKTCWILTVTYVGATTRDRVIVHYELQRDCPG